MSKNENKKCGVVRCPFTGIESTVKINRSNRLYYFNKPIGIVNPLGGEFQEWLRDNATFDKNYSELYKHKNTADAVSVAMAAPAEVADDHEIEICEAEKPPAEKSLIEKLFGEW